MEIELFAFPGKQFRLELSNADETLPQEQLLLLAVEALQLFCGDFLLPLSVDLRLACYDTELRFSIQDPFPEPEFFYLTSRESSTEVLLRPAWNNAIQQQTAKITSVSLLAWIRKSIHQANRNRRSAQCFIDWNEILLRSFRVRLDLEPEDMGNIIQFRGEYGLIEHPIERGPDGIFAYGPLKKKTLLSPVELRIENDYGTISLVISIFWSMWSDPKFSGYRQFEEVLRRLEQNNWLVKN